MVRRKQGGIALFETVLITVLVGVALLGIITIFANDRKRVVHDTMSGSVREGRGQDGTDAPDMAGAGDHDTANPNRRGGSAASPTTPIAPATSVTAPEPPSKPDSAGTLALAKATTQVGVKEATGNNDGVPSVRYMFGRKVPWCAYFVAWTFKESGNPLPGNAYSLGSVQYMEDQMKKAGKWTAAAKADPKPGDIIFFSNRGGSDSGPGRHVGMVEKVEDGWVHTIEGNSANGVTRRKYKLDNARISGYGRQVSA